jgi:hypothetical protein
VLVMTCFQIMSKQTTKLEFVISLKVQCSHRDPISVATVGYELIR